jgi:hypothetical protein
MNILLTMIIVHAQTNLFDSRVSKGATEDDLLEEVFSRHLTFCLSL